MVIPRRFSSSRRSASMPVRARTRAVLPWSMWPAVPTIIFFMPLILILLLGSGLLAQQKDDEIPVFRSGVTLVKVDIAVTTGAGRAIGDLTQQDFTVFDENERQEIAYFGRESEPLDLLLLLDISGSMRRSLEDVASVTRAALAQLHAGDRVGLMLFSRRAEVVQEFTPDFAPPDVFSISERTGGEAVEGLGKVGELFPKMIERVRSRYFIQYPAPHAEAGAFRRVRVELTPAARRKYPGAVVRAREGYYAAQ